jgi:hypothetical protein
MRRQRGPVGFKRDHLLTPNITGIVGDLAGPYVKGVSLNCKNLSSQGCRFNPLSKLLRFWRP